MWILAAAIPASGCCAGGTLSAQFASAAVAQASSDTTLSTSPDDSCTFFPMSPENSFFALCMDAEEDQERDSQGCGKRLLEVGQRSSQQMSNLYSIIEPLHRLLTGPGASTLRDPEMKQYATVAEALEHAATGSLAFDSHQLNHLTDGHPLSALAMFLFRSDDIFGKLGLNEAKAQSFFDSVEASMHDHPYHNRIHVADVLQALYASTLEGGGLHTLCRNDPLLLMAVLLAAVIHDIDHPGTNNDFLMRSGHPIALQYEDNKEGSPLELHHIQTGLGLLRREENNFLEPLSMEEWELLWAIVREMVLNTDMKMHMPFLEKAKLRASDDGLSSQADEDPCIITEKGLVMAAIQFSMAMKCADLGHCLRPPSLHIRWTQAVTSEFYRQGDWEAKLGLPVTQGMFRPAEESEIYQSQAWFLETYLCPMFEQWCTISECERSRAMLVALERNIKQWKRLAGGQEEEGANTGAVRLLRSVSLSREEKAAGALCANMPQSGTPTGLLSPRFTSSLRSIPSTEYLSAINASDLFEETPPSPSGNSALLESLASTFCPRSRYSKSCVYTGAVDLRQLLGEGVENECSTYTNGTAPRRRHTTHHQTYSRMAAEAVRSIQFTVRHIEGETHS